MHELGALVKACRAAERAAADAGVDKVDTVTLEVGALTGLLPEWLEKYYPLATEDSPSLAGSRLIVRTVPGVLRCRACGKEYETDSPCRSCPGCGSEDIGITGGEKFRLIQITAKEAGA